MHDDPSEEHWWRGCKSDHGESLGCTQHNFFHHDHEELVDECVCKEALCNREMGPIETSTSVSTTTIKGIKQWIFSFTSNLRIKYRARLNI